MARSQAGQNGSCKLQALSVASTQKWALKYSRADPHRSHWPSNRGSLDWKLKKSLNDSRIRWLELVSIECPARVSSSNFRYVGPPCGCNRRGVLQGAAKSVQ